MKCLQQIFQSSEAYDHKTKYFPGMQFEMVQFLVPIPRNTNCTQGMGLSMLALKVIAVRNVIAFCTRGMGPRTTSAKMRTQDFPLSCVQGSDATTRRPYTRLYAGH
jgi:hypothetical protein